MTVLVVTGTGTGVGKTVAVAALSCHARQAGMDVAAFLSDTLDRLGVAK